MSAQEWEDAGRAVEPPEEVLFECDQCTNQEWRPPDQEPWLCEVCGNMRWSVVGDQNP